MAIANNKVIVAFAAAMIVVSAVLGVYLISSTLPGVSTTPTLTTSSTETTNSTLGLELSASINSSRIVSGQAINISLSLKNTLPQINNVSGEWDWALSSLENFSYATVPCPRWDTFRVFSGYFSQSNISTATPLFLWPAGMGLSCPFWNFSNYIFQPSSSVTNVSNTFPPNYDLSFNTTEIDTLSGYYPPRQSTFGSSDSSQANPLPAGPYTIVAGDEWGQSVMLHFDVTQGSMTTANSTSCQAIGRVISNMSTGPNEIGGPIAYDTHLKEFYATGNSFNYLGPGLQSDVYAIGNVDTNSTPATIGVGKDPTDIAYDPNNNNLYVTNFGSNSVSVISDASNTVIGNITVGSSPVRITYDPNNQYIYVSNRNSGTVSVINPATDKVISNITVSSSPFEITYDSSNHYLYVTDGRQGNVTIIDSGSNNVVGSFSIGQGSGMIVYDSANNDLYFFPQDSQVLYIINGANNKVIGNVSRIFDLNAIGFDPANGDLYAAGNASGGFLDVISGGSNNGSNVIASFTGQGWVPVDFTFANGNMYLGTNYGKSIFVLSSTGTSGPGVRCVNPSYTPVHFGTSAAIVGTTR